MLLRIHVVSPFDCGKEKGSMSPLFCQIREILWDICEKISKKAEKNILCGLVKQKNWSILSYCIVVY